jgi:hypothetical protein
MSSKAKLFPLSSTGDISCRAPVRGSWGEPPANLEDMQFLRSWLVYDSEIQHNFVSGRSHRSIALGLALAFCISASFWTGIGLIVASVWK